MALTIAVKRAHRWDVTPAEAREIQERLRQYTILRDGLGGVRTVAGLDVGFPGRLARAAAAVFTYPGLEFVASAVAEREVEFPYVPGLLTFREGPAALAALDALSVPWDILLCDGHGYAHPRRLGLASHLGVVLDRPSVGCAKSRLIGTYGEVGEEPGSRSDLVADGAVIGAVVRTRRGSKPVFVSVGHRVDLASAVELVLGCTRSHRLPEPAQRAHELASEG